MPGNLCPTVACTAEPFVGGQFQQSDLRIVFPEESDRAVRRPVIHDDYFALGEPGKRTLQGRKISLQKVQSVPTRDDDRCRTTTRGLVFQLLFLPCNCETNVDYCQRDRRCPEQQRTREITRELAAGLRNLPQPFGKSR